MKRNNGAYTVTTRRRGADDEVARVDDLVAVRDGEGLEEHAPWRPLHVIRSFPRRRVETPVLTNNITSSASVNSNEFVATTVWLVHGTLVDGTLRYLIRHPYCWLA